MRPLLLFGRCHSYEKYIWLKAINRPNHLFVVFFGKNRFERRRIKTCPDGWIFSGKFFFNQVEGGLMRSQEKTTSFFLLQLFHLLSEQISTGDFFNPMAVEKENRSDHADAVRQ